MNIFHSFDYQAVGLPILPPHPIIARSVINSADDARKAAVEWQAWQSDKSLTYVEVVNWQAYFEAIGKAFGLTEEFKENGII